MEIILQEDYPALGFIGDRVVVKNGYARNYLIPKGIALEASSRNARKLRHHIEQINAIRNKKKVEAEELKTALESLTLNFTLKIGEKGKSFGSVSLKDIELALAEKGYSFNRRQIKLSEAIKSGGDYQVEIKIHAEVAAVIQVKVDAELVKTKKEASEKKEKAEAEREEAAADQAAESEPQSTDPSEANEADKPADQ